MRTHPVAFLDIDETVGNHRAKAGTGQWCDPVSMGLLRRFCQDTGARIVVTSTWRSSPDRCAAIFDQFDLKPHLWSPVGRSPVGLSADDAALNDWCVDADNGSRSATIIRWLDAHPQVTDWVVFDDSKSDLTPDQLGRLIHVDPIFGLDVRDTLRARRLLGQDVDVPPAFDRDLRPRYTIANLAAQAAAAIDQGDDQTALDLLRAIAGHPLAQ